MTRQQTFVTYKNIKYKDVKKYLNSSHDKEYNGTQFCRLELPQPSYHSIKILYVFLWNALQFLHKLL